MALAPAKPEARAKALPALRATAPRPHAAMAHKAHPALKDKVKAMAAVTAHAAKNNGATRALTTGVRAKPALHRAAHDQKAVAPHGVAKVGIATMAIMTTGATMAMSCRATLTL